LGRLPVAGRKNEKTMPEYLVQFSLSEENFSFSVNGKRQDF
jgi:hypothetical protein